MKLLSVEHTDHFARILLSDGTILHVTDLEEHQLRALEAELAKVSK